MFTLDTTKNLTGKIGEDHYIVNRINGDLYILINPYPTDDGMSHTTKQMNRGEIFDWCRNLINNGNLTQEVFDKFVEQ